MPPLEFRDPVFLWTALLAVPVFLLARRSPERLRFSSLRWYPDHHATPRTVFVWVPAALLAMAMVLFAVALAGPRVGDRKSRVHRKGIAIVAAIDISGSMRALDLSGDGEELTRLGAVKKVFHEFVDGGSGVSGRPDDAIGLVTFARFADARSPLTLDHRNLLAISDDLDFVSDRNEDGTALGDGLALALERLRENPAQSKVVILLTDGAQNAGEMSPVQGAQVAEALGIKVYTIGAGTAGSAPVRVEDPLSGRSVIQLMPVEIDEESMKEIASRTGGRYFRATDGNALREIFREIGRLERTDIVEERFLNYDEYFGWFALAGALAACAGWLLGTTVFRRYPAWI